MKKGPVVFCQIIVNFQPRQFALVVDVERWMEVFGLFHRSGIKMHTASVVMGFKPQRGTAMTAEMAKNTF